MRVASSPAIAEMVDVTDRVALLTLAIRGDFEKEIADTKAALKAFNEANEKVLKIKDADAYAEKTRGDADTYAQGVRDKADALTKAAMELADKAKSKVSAIEGRETSVGAREATVDARQRQLDAREKAIADTQLSKDAELRERETKLGQNEAAYIGRARQLDTDRADFNKRLEKLKA